MEEIEAFLLKVINSCQTEEQLSWARQWSLRVQDLNPSYAVSLALKNVDERIQLCNPEIWQYGQRHPYFRALV